MPSGFNETKKKMLLRQNTKGVEEPLTHIPCCFSLSVPVQSHKQHLARRVQPVHRLKSSPEGGDLFTSYAGGSASFVLKTTWRTATIKCTVNISGVIEKQTGRALPVSWAEPERGDAWKEATPCTQSVHATLLTAHHLSVTSQNISPKSSQHGDKDICVF